MFSVLLSVYKKEAPDFLNQALASIYDDQTLKPSQIVLVQDGALTPELDNVVTAWQEKLGDVLTVVPLGKNVGLGAALNEGLKYCNHELVARMDTDDISLPDRFSIQVEFMKSNPKVVASSATIQEFDEALSVSKGFRRLPVKHSEIILFAKRRSPLNHIPSIFRKSVVQGVNGYPPLRKAQDYALWSLLIVKGYQLANLDDVLAYVRAGDGLIERRGWEYFKQEYQLLKYQKEIGFLSYKDYIINIVIKGCLRISPASLKRWAYKYARSFS